MEDFVAVVCKREVCGGVMMRMEYLYVVVRWMGRFGTLMDGQWERCEDVGFVKYEGR